VWSTSLEVTRRETTMTKTTHISEKNIVKAYKVMYLVAHEKDYTAVIGILGISRTSASVHLHALLEAFKKIGTVEPILHEADAWTIKNNPDTFMRLTNAFVKVLSEHDSYRYAIREIKSFIDIQEKPKDTMMGTHEMILEKQVDQDEMNYEDHDECYYDPSDKDLVQELNEQLDFAVDELDLLRRENVRLNKIINKIIG
jgi:hypothetical protein